MMPDLGWLNTVLPGSGIFIAIGIYLATVKTYGTRISKIEIEYQESLKHIMSIKSLQNDIGVIRDDVQYLRQRIDYLANNLGK